MALLDNINHLQKKINEAAHSVSRKASDVLLVAVSKQQSSQKIAQAFHLGISDFGENYYQEAAEKIQSLSHLAINWHFIGRIQSNKAANIAKNFAWVHSVDSLDLAKKLSQARAQNLAPLNICLQINIAKDCDKAGISQNEAYNLAQAVNALPSLKLRGLMTILAKSGPNDYELFLQLKELMLRLNKELNLSMDTLSMGMSDDFIAAIKAGATIIRIGRMIFGERK